MIKPYKLLLVLLSICTVLVSFCACGPSEEQDPPAVHKDYAAEVKLDMASSTVKKEVTVKTTLSSTTMHILQVQLLDGWDPSILRLQITNS